jgi:hypothetical protein
VATEGDRRRSRYSSDEDTESDSPSYPRSPTPVPVRNTTTVNNVYMMSGVPSVRMDLFHEIVQMLESRIVALELDMRHVLEDLEENNPKKPGPTGMRKAGTHYKQKLSGAVVLNVHALLSWCRSGATPSSLTLNQTARVVPAPPSREKTHAYGLTPRRVAHGHIMYKGHPRKRGHTHG